MPSVLINAAIAILIFAPTILAAAQPQVVKWSDKSYGPDGPWAAVTVEIGTPEKIVDLLPGGSWMTNILGEESCDTYTNITDCPAEAAGLYNYRDSKSSVRTSATGSIKDKFDENPGSLAAVTEGDAGWVFDLMTISAADGGAGFTNKISIPSFSMIVFTRARMSLPDGTLYGPTIGKLALGARDKNQTWAQGPSKPLFNGTLLTSNLFERGRTPSDSYSMHVGSPSMKIPGSLILGGYHKDRALGDVSVQPYDFDDLPIDLLDIGIGVADGASPFNFTTKTGLLAEGGSSLDAGQKVTVDATQPYLYLPPSTCEAIASHLPVTFQSKYGLYFWDTISPQYQKIIKSPAFLEFTFRQSTSVSSSISIKVPFALLNLTLTSPIIQTPTPYFPCFSGRDPTGDYSLGRAFLQAAFIGVKWEAHDTPGNWFLAQAPGPNTPKTMAVTNIDNTIVSSTTKWEDTWKGFWTVEKSLEEDGTSGNGSSPSGTGTNGAAVTATIGSATISNTSGAGLPGYSGFEGQGSSSGPPIGAIAGGAVGGVFFLGGLVFAFIFYRRKKAKRLAAKSAEHDLSPFVGKSDDGNSGWYGHKAELDGEREVAEVPGQSYHGGFGQNEGQDWKGNVNAQHERGLGIQGHIAEMGTGRAPVEMYAPWSPKGI